MARTTTSNPSQPNDASQETQRGENPLVQRERLGTERGRGKARERGEAQVAGTEEVLMERARVSGDLIQGCGLVNGHEEGLVTGSGSARASNEASAPPAPVENAQPELDGPTLNVFPSSLREDEMREGMRRFCEREALRMRNEQAAQELLRAAGSTGLVNDNLPLVNGIAQRAHAEQPVPMDEDGIAHLNNPPVARRALSREIRGQEKEGTHRGR
jgi:hypothetical protein